MAALRELARAPRFALRVAWVERKVTVAGGLQAQLWLARAPDEAEALGSSRSIAASWCSAGIRWCPACSSGSRRGETSIRSR